VRSAVGGVLTIVRGPQLCEVSRQGCPYWSLTMDCLFSSGHDRIDESVCVLAASWEGQCKGVWGSAFKAFHQ